MDVANYRKAYLTEIADAAPSGAEMGLAENRRPTKELLAVLRDRSAGDGARIAVLDELTPEARAQKGVIEALLRVLAADDESPAVRLAVVAMLSELSFAVGAFQPYKPAYKEALRAAATAQDRKLRERVLEILALQNDEYAQRLIVDGLNDPKKALLSTRRAVQYLGYDVHAEHHELLQDLVGRSSDKKVRNAALRLLAADSGSIDLFSRIVQDKNEDPETRSIGAVALQSLAPEEFVPVAKDIVLDDGDDDRVRTSLLTALEHDDIHGVDASFGASLAEGMPQTASKPLMRAARKYIAAAGPVDDPTP